ncbi:hypothetical protein B296_00041409 [Ensete ventricosum]|uniref:Plant heme peroxidase family profile domain-containing protein n=1 Tax=Ensete ventricosum TaxID=4639 RepID=A0A426X1A2_ENSVE|nr:hypothetical protein B296_00041409 [Ensete ventricosum]
MTTRRWPMGWRGTSTTAPATSSSPSLPAVGRWAGVGLLRRHLPRARVHRPRPPAFGVRHRRWPRRRPPPGLLPRLLRSASPPNQTLRPKALEVIDDLRSLVEHACGLVVSCADITALAAREAVFLVCIHFCSCHSYISLQGFHATRKKR